MTTKNRLLLARILAVLAVIIISVIAFSVRDRAQEFAKYGYPGIFILSILSNATIILPAPGFIFVFTMGAVLNPALVAIVAGVGAAIGELAGYLIGFSGQGIAEKADVYIKMYSWMQAHHRLSYFGFFVLAFIPNPFFDLAGVAAGALKFPVIPFFLCTVFGKILKMLVIAYAGATTLDWLIKI